MICPKMVIRDCIFQKIRESQLERKQREGGRGVGRLHIGETTTARTTARPTRVQYRNHSPTAYPVCHRLTTRPAPSGYPARTNWLPCPEITDWLPCPHRLTTLPCSKITNWLPCLRPLASRPAPIDYPAAPTGYPACISPTGYPARHRLTTRSRGALRNAYHRYPMPGKVRSDRNSYPAVEI